MIDESRGVIYYASVNSIASYPDDNPYSTSWFFTIALDGSSYSRDRLTKPSPGKTNDAHYPHLYLDEHNDLYAAWTTSSGQSMLLGSYTDDRGLTSVPRTLHFFKVPVPSRPLDYDRDSKADPAFYRPSNGYFAWLNAAIGLESRPLLPPVAGDVPLSGDYDGDDKADPAIFRASTGVYHYASSANNYTVVDRPFTYPSGGDGKTDPAIFRYSTGAWHYASSANNYAVVNVPFTYPSGGDIALGMPIMTP